MELVNRFPTESYLNESNLTPDFYNQHKSIIREPRVDPNYGVIYANGSYAPQNAWLGHATVNMMLFAIMHKESLKRYTGEPYTNLYFEHTTASFSSQDVEAYKDSGTFPITIGNTTAYQPSDRDKVITFMHITSGRKIFNICDEHFTDEKMISLALQEDRGHKVRVYKNENHYFILTTKHNWTLVRKVVALIPKLFPQIEISKEVENLCRLYGAGDYDKWISEYIPWFNNLDYIIERKKKQLQQTLEYKNTIRKQRIISTITDLKSQIRENRNTLSSLYNQLQEENLQLSALELTENIDAEEFFKYLENHPYIRDYKIVDNNKIYYNIIAPAIYYDQAVMKKYIDNPRSIIRDSEFITEFFKQIFIEQNYTLYLHANALWKLEDNSVTRGEQYPENIEGLLQPHIQFANCWGTNNDEARIALTHNNYINAIEQTIAAVQNLNFYDSIIVGRMIREVKDEENRYKKVYCIEDNETKERFTLNKFKNKLFPPEVLEPEDTSEGVLE